MVFSDASRSNENSQLGFIFALLIGDLKAKSTVHVLSWALHKCHRQVKSIGSAATIAASQAIDEVKLLKLALKVLLQTSIEFVLVVESKALFDSLTSCRDATDRSIRGDVSVIRFQFETRSDDKVIWINGSSNLSDKLKKPTVLLQIVSSS